MLNTSTYTSKMNDTINILCCTDANFVPYCGVMLTSLFENNKDEHFRIYVATATTNSPKLEKLCSLVEKYKHEVSIIHITDQQLKDLGVDKKMQGHISIATYYRIFASELLPSAVHKILYLDGDMIVNAAIRPLWEVPVEEVSVAAAIDCLYFDEDIYHRLSYPKDKEYFNAGVLLLNIDKLKEEHFLRKSIELMMHHLSSLKYHDQDVLNKVLVDSKSSILLTYNFQFFYFIESHFKHFPKVMQDEILETMSHPAIIHYCGPAKPWQLYYYGRPYNKLWWHYQKMSPFKIKLKWKPLKRNIKWIAKVIGVKLGIFPHQRLGLAPMLNHNNIKYHE